jgi:23S rRNA (cytidine1920-2'-O)/16S rRNA (cytidine1409-2'-O)-methyltransferase
MKMRLDQLLVLRGLAESRARAQAAIVAGGVTVDGAYAGKASELVREDAALSCTPPHPYVSRGGVKLAHALTTFGIDPAGRVCLDVGASTGGFTEVLLARGARRVTAVDVGHGQLHARLAGDARVTALEGVDARALTHALIGEAPSLIVADVSFIGLAKALPVPLSLASERADLVALVKPQFEAGPRAGKGGVLTEAVAREAADRAIAAIDGLEGFAVQFSCDSPLRGADGNLEILVHARRSVVGNLRLRRIDRRPASRMARDSQPGLESGNSEKIRVQTRRAAPRSRK